MTQTAWAMHQSLCSPPAPLNLSPSLLLCTEQPLTKQLSTAWLAAWQVLIARLGRCVPVLPSLHSLSLL